MLPIVQINCYVVKAITEMGGGGIGLACLLNNPQYCTYV